MRILAIATLLLCGCASLSEDDLYERENALIIAMEDYHLRNHKCRDAGNFMLVKRRGTRIQTGPTKYELESARCMRF